MGFLHITPQTNRESHPHRTRSLQSSISLPLILLRRVRMADHPGGGEIMLFGVRVVVDAMRKSVSLNNLSQYVHHPSNSNSKDKDAAPVTAAGGYASADDAAHRSANNRVRKRGVPWTEEEHRRFLIGLKKLGKGDWRGIAKNYVITRTPTQVASHAQKYFIRRSNADRRRRRSSLFDITADTVAGSLADDQDMNHHAITHSTASFSAQENNSSNISSWIPVPLAYSLTIIRPPVALPSPTAAVNGTANQTPSRMQVAPAHSITLRTGDEIDLNAIDPFLSLNLSLSSSSSSSSSAPDQGKSSTPRNHHSSFDIMPNFQASIVGIA